MRKNGKGCLIIIGGHESKGQEAERPILELVASRVSPRGRLALVTVASQDPQALAAEYTRVFGELGVAHVDHLDIRRRGDAETDQAAKTIRNARVVFFTGGDQLRISSQIGDSLVYQTIQEVYRHGVTVAGTSAGAAVMPDTMLVSGDGDESSQISALGMAPGLGLIEGVVIDSHFAERGRFGRLIGAVTQNPKNLGLGIDEDTAVMVENNHFTVLGSGAVYVLDGSDVTYSSLSEEQPEGVLSVFNVKVHVLAKGDCFDMRQRRPSSAEEMGKASRPA